MAVLVAALVLSLNTHAALSDARVLADEIITMTSPSNNGSSPMWSVGAPLLVRERGNVWASISIHDPEARAYCNTHWELWRRPESGGWERVRQGPAASEREPCPLFMPEPGKLMLSIHPKILEREQTSNGETTWFCQPAIAQFDPVDAGDEPRLVQPGFDGRPAFNQHTYRSIGVDPPNSAFLMMVIGLESGFHMTRRDAAGAWHPVAEPAFPIRACYPNILLRGKEGHVFAIGDIKEPVEAWRAEKFRVLNREWDYAFRRVFYSRAANLDHGSFDPPLEVDSVDDTAGWAFNLDMAVDRGGRVHLLWVRQNIQYAFLRDRFFPGVPIVEEVRHAALENGRVVSTEILSSREVDGGTRGWQFTSGRFHQLADGRLIVALFANVSKPGEPAMRELHLQELDHDAKSSPPPVRIQVGRPPQGGWFFTNTARGGSRPDNNLDILTTETKDDVISIRYIHVVVPE